MDAPFDRGEVDRSSIEATERLRARLSGRPPAPAATRRSSVLPWVVAGSLFVFTAGMIANPWFEARVRNQLPFAASESTEAAPAADTAALQARIAQLEVRAGPAAAVPVERLARTEAQIETSTDQIARESDRIDRLTSEVAELSATLKADQERSAVATATATAAADRAQAMLALVLARQAIDKGRPFGTLDPVLRQSFAERYPAAVKAVTALGNTPVTPAALQRDFAAMQSALGGPPAAGARLSWWDALTSRLSTAVSPAPTPVTAAAAALQRGDVAAAAAQLRRLPGARPEAVSRWLAAADRYSAGMEGLAVLENAVVLVPTPPAKVVPAA
jgi:hypothetical protein